MMKEVSLAASRAQTIQQSQPQPAVANPIEHISVLGVEGLRKSYRKRTVVDNVSLDIRQTEIVGLLGPNGAGKTTIFYMIVGLERPDSGMVYLDSKDLSRLPMYLRARSGISYLPQEASVFRKLTVEENILLVLQTLPLTKQEREHRLESLPILAALQPGVLFANGWRSKCLDGRFASWASKIRALSPSLGSSSRIWRSNRPSLIRARSKPS